MEHLPVLEQQPAAPEPKPSKRKIIILIIAILALMIGVGVGLYFLLIATASKPVVNQQPKPVPKQSVKRAAYAIEAGGVLQGDRQFTKYEVWYVDAGSAPQSLGVFGEAGKYFYANNAKLSRDGKKIYLKYDTTLESLDIASKKVKTIYSAPTGRTVDSYIQSQSGKELLVSSSDATNNPGRETVTLDRIDVASNKITNEYKGQRSDVLLQAWRSDDVVVFNDIMYSEFTRYGTYNLNTKTLTNTADGKHNAQEFTASQNGKTIGISSATVKDICNGFAGASTSQFTLIDPFTEKTISTIDVTDNIITDVELGPNKKVIVTTRPLTTDRTKCESTEAGKLSHAVYDISTKTLQTKSNYKEAYRETFGDTPFIEARFENKVCTLTFESQQLLTKTCPFEPAYVSLGVATISQ